MKSNFRKTFKSILFVSFIFVVFAAITLCASAKNELKFYIDGVSSTEEVEKINTTVQSDGVAWLIVPSSAKADSLKVFFDGETMTVKAENGEAVTIQNGVPTDAFKNGGNFTVTLGKTSGKLAVSFTNSAAVIIETESGSLAKIHADKNYKEPGTIVIGNSKKIRYNGVLASMKGRGNATWNASKKPYNIKLDKKTDLFGMGKAKSWCLLANYYDNTRIKNALALSLAEKTSLTYTSKRVPANLFANGEYIGFYTLCEKVEIGDNRIEINDLAKANEKINETEDLERFGFGGSVKGAETDSAKWVNLPNDPDDITGGYLLEVELAKRYQDEISGFVTKRGIPVVVKEPECASRAQVEYIKAYFREFEDAVYSANGVNELGKHYSEYCDMQSLVDAFLIRDFCVELDSGITSCYFIKDSNDIMKAGPAWDFDLSLGTETERNGYKLSNPKTEFVRNGVMYDNKNCDTIFNALYDHADFEAAVLESWNGSFKPIRESAIDFINSYSTEFATDTKIDLVVWAGVKVSNADSFFASKIETLKKFVSERSAYLDEYYKGDHTAVPHAEPRAVGGFAGFIQKLRAFFASIVNFFKNLFK